jgi:hypothetical protein
MITTFYVLAFLEFISASTCGHLKNAFQTEAVNSAGTCCGANSTDSVNRGNIVTKLGITPYTYTDMLGSEWDSESPTPSNYKLRVSLPASITEVATRPVKTSDDTRNVLIVLHGGGLGSTDTVKDSEGNDVLAGGIELVDSFGPGKSIAAQKWTHPDWIIIQPQGTNGFVGWSAPEIRKVVEYAHTKYGNSSNIFMTGWSSGGSAVVKYLAEYSSAPIVTAAFVTSVYKGPDRAWNPWKTIDTDYIASGSTTPLWMFASEGDVVSPPDASHAIATAKPSNVLLTVFDTSVQGDNYQFVLLNNQPITEDTRTNDARTYFHTISWAIPYSYPAQKDALLDELSTAQFDIDPYEWMMIQVTNV